MSASKNTKNFTDVGINYWAYIFIDTLIDLGIIDGYSQPDGTFRYEPENEITRAEIMKLIVATLELPLDENYDGSMFADWDAVADWAKPYIGVLVNLGIVQGSLEDMQLFINADSNITRQEMVAMTVRALAIDVPVGDIPSRSIYDLQTAAEWARDSLVFAVNNDMINIDEGYVNPTADAKRSEAAMMIYRMLEFIIRT